LKIQKYNYSIIFFLCPKGMSNGRPNARSFLRVIGGLQKLYFINNLSPWDKLHIACTTTNLDTFLFIKKTLCQYNETMWHVEGSPSNLYIFNNHLLLGHHKRDPIHGVIPLLEADCWEIACYNWKGKTIVHFHKKSTCNIFLLIRACGFFGLVEYIAHPNLIPNHDPAKFNE